MKIKSGNWTEKIRGFNVSSKFNLEDANEAPSIIITAILNNGEHDIEALTVEFRSEFNGTIELIVDNNVVSTFTEYTLEHINEEFTEQGRSIAIVIKKTL